MVPKIFDRLGHLSLKQSKDSAIRGVLNSRWPTLFERFRRLILPGGEVPFSLSFRA